MEETLYDKMLAAVHQTIDTNGNGQDEVDCAKVCANIGIQAQVDLLKNQNEKLTTEIDNINSMQSKRVFDLKNQMDGKIKGIELAKENNRQEIQELSKQLS